MSMINWKDFLLFAVVMFVASIIAGLVKDVVAGPLGDLGIVGDILLYLILVVPAYFLLQKLWRKQRAF